MQLTSKYLHCTYVNYIKNNFSQNCSVIFDGYSINIRSTKNSERLRRLNNCFSAKINIIQINILCLDSISNFPRRCWCMYNLYKPIIGRTKKKYYTRNSFKKKNLKDYVLFLYDFSGCDTTSAFAGMGKKNLRRFAKIWLFAKGTSNITSAFLWVGGFL